MLMSGKHPQKYLMEQKTKEIFYFNYEQAVVYCIQ